MNMFPDWLKQNLPDEDEGLMTGLRQDYADSQRHIKDWEEDQDDFFKAYQMLDTHPAFWTRQNSEPTWDWKTSGHTQSFWHGLGHDCLMMECGGHVPEHYTNHFHDIRLDTWGYDFADCIVKTAKLVHKFFHPNGTERENVEYEKSQLEIELDEAIASVKETNPEMFT